LNAIRAILCQPHFRKGHEKGQRRFRSLVFAIPVRVQPIAGMIRRSISRAEKCPWNRSSGKDDPNSTPSIHAAELNLLAATDSRGAAAPCRRAISKDRTYRPAVLLHTIARPNL